MGYFEYQLSGMLPRTRNYCFFSNVFFVPQILASQANNDQRFQHLWNASTNILDVMHSKKHPKDRTIMTMSKAMKQIILCAIFAMECDGNGFLGRSNTFKNNIIG